MRKDAPIIGRTINEAAFLANYGVIVVGAELSGKSTSHTELGDLTLGPKDLLVCTAREWRYLQCKCCATSALILTIARWVFDLPLTVAFSLHTGVVSLPCRQ